MQKMNLCLVQNKFIVLKSHQLKNFFWYIFGARWLRRHTDIYISYEVESQTCILQVSLLKMYYVQDFQCCTIVQIVQMFKMQSAHFCAAQCRQFYLACYIATFCCWILGKELGGDALVQQINLPFTTHTYLRISSGFSVEPEMCRETG